MVVSYIPHLTAKKPSMTSYQYDPQWTLRLDTLKTSHLYRHLWVAAEEIWLLRQEWVLSRDGRRYWTRWVWRMHAKNHVTKVQQR